MLMRNSSSHSLIGLMADRHPDLLIGMLGILKSGSGFAPIDPDYPDERINYIINDCRIEILITEEKRLARAIEISRKSPSLKHVICLDNMWRKEAVHRDEVQTYDCNNYRRDLEPDQLAYVIYTSGSTGVPKGVPITHRNLSPLLCWSKEYFNLGEGTTVLQNLNYCFDFGVFELLTTVLFGGTLHFVDRDGLSDFSEYAGYINEHRINTIHSTPSFFRNLLPFSDKLETLEALHLGGEPLTGNMVDEVFNKVGTDCVIYNGYGPTESTINCSIFEVGKRSAWKDKAFANIPIGKPSANNFIYILNKDREPVLPGTPGELYVGGVGLTYGYLNRADLTAERFVPDPFSNEPGAHLYRTGDLARYLANGNIEFLGRIDDQVKVRGFRIELGEIESALRGHPAVQETVVLAREGMDGNKRLVAYLIPKSEVVPSISELRSFLQEKLPEYMVPTAYVFLGALPLTPNGKVDRRALPEPDQTRPDLTNHFVAPRDRKEEILAEIWSQVIGVERVGVYDNFFELGGDSMKSIQVVARANRAGLHFTPAQLFHHPTIADLVRSASASKTAGAEQGIVTGPVPLTPIQRSFFERHSVDQHHWNWSFLREMPQALNPALLDQTIKHLLGHHDALRLRCCYRSESGWQQFNQGLDESAPLTFIDLSQFGGEEQIVALEAAAAALQGSLNLAEGPLMRVAYFTMGGKQNDRALLIFHHLVVDVVSAQILMEDLQTIYWQLSLGEAIELPLKTTSFREWSLQLAAHAQSSELKQELGYWMESVRGERPSLPLDYPAGVNTEASSETVLTAFSVEETRALLQKMPAATGALMQDFLLTALTRSWARWTGQPRLLVDVDGHGREGILNDVDLSRTVGWFTSAYPMLLDIGDAAEPGEALRVIQAQMRRVPNRGIGFGLLRYLCDDEEVRRRISMAPRAEVNFNYQGQLDQQGADRNGMPFRPARENKGPERSLRGQRSYRLYVVGNVHGGLLSMRWSYSANLHKRSTIERLAASFAEELRRLIALSLNRRPQD
jgi:amino acid adenylation domain-containing protein/non-ribosomal peptide synthase protein (TIGR01720 family)